MNQNRTPTLIRFQHDKITLLNSLTLKIIIYKFFLTNYWGISS